MDGRVIDIKEKFFELGDTFTIEVEKVPSLGTLTEVPNR